MRPYRECDTLAKFDLLCQRHDWFYYMSDMNLSDQPAKELRELAAKNGVEWQRVYNREHAKRFNTPSFYPTDGSCGTYKPVFNV